MDAAMIEKAANALADKNRMAILMKIARQENCCCGEIQDMTCLSQPTVSHHIKILVDSGVLISTKEGRNVTLSINKDMMKHLSMFFLQLS
ncbi:ArsR family transcriptional regulator [Chitinophaga lutea]|uniref:ArsR family transcriptional regulator n=1 Tax=Chitinophaga lutea TaxID=2488634 RepID=A0A3N4PJV9_9BACT|nr:metalloregulator ArsR/SmtB family transcription factor [Chitinophaga lutea]RPE08973.1 ArsR family transcriptional regulator [Chitinophaga lutea]